jgi:hypothetical protein
MRDGRWNAARALSRARAYAEWRQADPGRIIGYPDVNIREARTVCETAADARGDDWLTADELARVLSAYRLPLVTGVVAADANDAANQAAQQPFPVVAKILSPSLVHKSDVGGVRTSLHTADEVRHAAGDLLAIAAAHGIDGAAILIQPMVTDGVETMIGVTHDPLFGPLVGFGLGGVDVELEQDVHFRAAPLSDADAADLIRESRARLRLGGYRGRPAADVPALTELLLRVSQLAGEIPEVLELDLNPVMVLPAGRGCAIVDARLKVGRRTTGHG